MTARSILQRFLTVILLLTFVVASAHADKTLGKNPGKIKGRWLQISDVETLQSYRGVYVGDLEADIQWKRKENEAPIDEELLTEKMEELLILRLRQSKVFPEILEAPPEEGASGYLRLDCNIEVEPGSRLTRWAVGFGAGKSRSIFEIHLKDHTSGEEVGLYHGYGAGTGMGFKLAGGSARKMTQDDLQENTLAFVELVGQLK